MSGSDEWKMETGVFTIDFWAKIEMNYAHEFFQQYYDSNSYVAAYYGNGGIRFVSRDSGSMQWDITAPWTPSLNI